MRTELVGLVMVAVTSVAGSAAPERPRPAEASMRFASTRPGEVVLPVTLGAHGPYKFLVDTGSTHTAISEALATRLALRAVARTTMRASGGLISCLVVALPLLAAGPASADGLTATALPAAAAAGLGAGIEGIIGQDFLARFRYTIDYRRSRIVWHQDAYAPPGVRLTLVPAEDRWLVELPPAGDAPAWRFVPDSGADTMVVYGESAGDRLVTDWPGAPAELWSVTGTRAVRVGLVDGLRVGDARVRRQPAVVVAAPTTAADAPNGLLPLHGFASVYFNAPDRYLLIQPR